MWLALLLMALTPVDVVLLPAGSFSMGDADMPDARPVREVALSAYRIDLREVSIAEYEAFARGPGWTDAACWSDAGETWRKTHPVGAGATARASGRSGDHPVVAVTWFEAEAFCACRGGALPTEAQWERAACGVTPRPTPPAEGSGVRWFEEGKHGWIGEVHTHPVHNDAPQSPFGLSDTVGNVWEWTRDAYRADGYSRAGSTDPVATDESPWRSARGGSYLDLPSYAGCAHREPMRPEEPRLTVGFRCVYPP